ncbi:MAG: HAD family phosphatase [Oscillospiraceae bacterium]|jgi:beta-phosphoglucomutase-like phosphatase (HAD superfamily)|nr:HAD family phosphatase [Oscillospiraceae bacterium]
MPDFDAAIFDLDGTLLDSLGVWEKVDRIFLGARGLAVTPGYTTAMGAMSFEEGAEYTIRRYGLSETAEALISEWSGMVSDEYAHTIGLKPGAREYLSCLKEQGVKLGVATALPEELYGPALKNNGVYGFFEAFASVCEVKRGKGFPDVYLLAAKRLRTPPERCAAFEDVLSGIRGVRAAGMTAVGVYDSHSRGEESAIRAAANSYLRSWSEALPGAEVNGTC